MPYVDIVQSGILSSYRERRCIHPSPLNTKGLLINTIYTQQFWSKVKPYSPVFLHHPCPLYNCKNAERSCESVRPLLLYRLICVKKLVSSSNVPRSRPPFSAINAPIFQMLLHQMSKQDSCHPTCSVSVCQQQVALKA